MKILLIQSLSKNLRPVFPVGLARIISVIKDRHEVKVFDPNLVPRQHLRLLREILKSFQPDVTGISLRNIDSIDYIGREYFYPDFVAIVQLVKKESPDTRLVVGGGSFSLFSESIMKDRPEIDAGVLLDAEASFPELLDHLDHPEKVKGIYLKKGQSIIFTGHRSPVDLDQLPWPSYEFFDLDRYLSRIIGIGIESKRGCLLKCAYCPYPFLTGSHIRKRNPVNVVDEIEYLVNHYNIKTFSFLDSVFNLPLSHAEAIISEISKRNLKIQWSCWTNEKYFTESFARTAIKAGCVSFPLSTDAF